MRKVLRRTALSAFLGLVMHAVPARAEVPLIGGELRKIGEKEEARIGAGLASLILGTAPLLDDPVRQRRINRMGRWIALHSERPSLPWKFGIIDSPAFNAFSMPGGTALVTRGLVERMRNESELAAVLAHEIAHVEKRHHLGEMHLAGGLLAKEAGSFLDKLPIASLRNRLNKGLPGKALKQLDPGGSGVANQAYATLLEAGRDLFTRGLAKEEEYEADSMAAVLAARSGYSPFGLAGVLQTLSAEEQADGFALHTKTHPTALERIGRLDAVMGTRFDGFSGLADDVPGFAAMRDGRKPPHRRTSRKKP